MALLLMTTVLQVVVVTFSGSVALLADTVHNLGDALNSLPLLIAFYLARRAATRRYTYGFHRAEDVAGIIIVLSIVFSAVVVFWESFQKLIDPQPLQSLGWVAAAAIIGFLGNEAVALLQIRVGRRIGSAALVADGLHARTDGLTSLAVLVAAAGSWMGFPIADPLVGFAIGIAILFITRDAIRTMWYRLMDAVEPGLVDRAEMLASQQLGVKDVRRVRMRWVGHRLFGDVSIAVEPCLTTVESHEIAERVRHSLFHEIDRMGEIMVHVDPWSEHRDGFHELTVHHEPVPDSIP
jgi:cation diffusion facilitator family transporter